MKRQPKAPVTQAGAPNDLVVAEFALEQPALKAGLADELAFLRAITQNIGEGTYALDTEGRVTYMNPAAERMLGWTAAELHGKDMHETIHYQRADGTPFPREQCSLLQVIRSGQMERVEDDTFTRRDGTLFSVAYVSSPIMVNGVITGAVLAFHDISAHKELDEALRRSEREAATRASQLMAIFESMADAVLVYDRDGNILQTNGADANIFDVPTDAPNDSLRERDRHFTYLDGMGQPLSDEQRPTNRVLAGETLRGENAIDLVVRTRDGREVIMNASGAPIRDGDGHIVGGVLIGRDVTQRRRLERRTSDALAALMAMAEALTASGVDAAEGAAGSAPDTARRLAELAQAVMGCERVGVITFNLETQMIHTLAVAGLTKEQERLWTYTARLNNPPEIVERLQAGKVVVIDRTRPPYDQLPNPFGSSAMLLTPMSVGGPILGVITVDYGAVRHEFTAEELAMAGAVAKLAAQIIERERLARDRETARANALALAETTRRMDEFLSIAAHELKTPVTNSSLAVTLARDTLMAYIAGMNDSQEDLAQALQPIQKLLDRTGRHMDRLSQLVVDLLDVSRIRAGKLEMRVALCNLAELVREEVEEQRQIAPGRIIHMQLPGGMYRQPLVAPLVLADADRIRQVISNYLTNALKYSRADQPVNVRLRLADTWARVSVGDHGPGVPTAEQHHVWERFYRVPGIQVVSGASVGLGLGLHISRTIVEQHHGQVGLRSLPGRGSVFWFALQLLDDVATPG